MKLITVKPSLVKRGNKIFTRNSFSMLRATPQKPLITSFKSPIRPLR